MTKTKTEYKTAMVRLRSQGPGQEWIVPAELRPKLVADAEEKGTNMTDVALAILATRFKIPYEANGRKSTPKADDDLMILRLPWNLFQVISATATSRRWSYVDEIRSTLCAHYGLRYAGRPKHSRVRRAAAA